MEGKAALIVFSVADPEAAAAFYAEALKASPYVKSPYYTGFRQGDLEIGLAQPDPRRDTHAPLLFMETADIVQRLKELTAAGATIAQDVSEVGGGLQIAVVRDPNGNLLGLRQGMPQAQ